MEIVQWSIDFFTGANAWGAIPIIGDAFQVDWSRTYAYGSLGSTAMATSNMKCAANTYADLSKDFLPDYVFE